VCSPGTPCSHWTKLCVNQPVVDVSSTEQPPVREGVVVLSIVIVALRLVKTGWNLSP
jgi:hypothetical protein